MNLQAIADSILAKIESDTGKKLNRALVVSEEETNDIHITLHSAFINPFYLTSGFRRNPIRVIEHVLDLSLRYDEERARRTRFALDFHYMQLRASFEALSKLDYPLLLSTLEEYGFHYLHPPEPEESEEINVEIDED